jgi:hypothetical protein
MSKEPQETHAHDDDHEHAVVAAHDDHGHGHGHGDDAGEIIAEGSPSDFMLTVPISILAFLGFMLFSYLMLSGVTVPHIYPNAGPGMWVTSAEAAPHGKEGGHEHAAEHEGHE